MALWETDVHDIPTGRVRAVNQAPVNPVGEYVLYWMIAARRPHFNFALEHAVAQAQALGKGLVVLEALPCDDPWASDRLHAFVVQGMAANAAALARTGAFYLPYLEPAHGAGKGLLEALAARACLVVTDRFPAFLLPHMVATAGARLAVRLEEVDGNGLLPLTATERSFPSAYAFRRFLQQVLPGHLEDFPAPDPLIGAILPSIRLDPAITSRWPAAPVAELATNLARLAVFPIDHTVWPAPSPGGWLAARQTLEEFLSRKLSRYPDERNHPDADACSGLSPYLHFGHLGVHEILAELGRREGWSPERLATGGAGKRTGWWGLSPAAEAFLDELVTWRELGFNFAATRDDLESYDSLPSWARLTLTRHEPDPRPVWYGLEAFQAAATHDPVWNSAQRQLLREGRIHNYLRMVWGKKILQWSRTPREALAVMLELNNRFALDGRDPNSATGILWCLGRYDRPWGPERPIFGTIRYMSSDATARKLRMKEYLRRFGG
ncbi:MAG TPA: hypothetical protein PLS53_03525 [Thermoanaerobaculaceae bacterium]|nr:hypothetical protein [Thermoanaerobaculaceae bacterium]HPS77206.1 hypothetical protein [Thermoanaerobaculaceae bacterium]